MIEEVKVTKYKDDFGLLRDSVEEVKMANLRYKIDAIERKYIIPSDKKEIQRPFHNCINLYDFIQKLSLNDLKELALIKIQMNG